MIEKPSSILRSLPENTEAYLVSIKSLLMDSFDTTIWNTQSATVSYRDVIEVIARLTRVQAVALLLHDGRREELLLTAVAGAANVSLDDLANDNAGSVSAEMMDGNVSVLLNDLPSDSRMTRKWKDWWSTRLKPNTAQNAAFIPVYGDFELRCFLQFFNRSSDDGILHSGGFSTGDLEILEILSAFATVSLNKIWLMNRIDILNDAVKILPRQSDVQELANKIARTGVKLANATACAVLLPDPIKSELLKVRGSWGFRQSPEELTVPRGKSFAGRVIRRNQMEEVVDLRSDSDAYQQGPGSREGMVSVLGLPLGTAEQANGSNKEDRQTPPATGALVVYTKRSRRFHPSTRNLIQQFALSAGAVMETATRAETAEGLRQILAFAAHSLRSPLDRLGSTLSNIRRKDRGYMYSSEIQAGFRNLELVNARISTMLYSRSGIIEVTGLDVSRVELNKVIASCVARHKPQAAKNPNIQIKALSSVEQLPVIRGDKNKLDLVFDNLIENAVKYSWRGQEVVISAVADGGTVQVTVTDRGLGISEENKGKIFEAFFRSDVLDRSRHVPGTGLGLYVSKMIVDAHGGSIKVRSIPFLDDPERRLAYEGYETSFIVSLPVDGDF